MNQFDTVILDLDGTLLNNNHSVSEKTVQVLQKLSQRNVRIVVATGRAITTIYKILTRISFGKPIPVVCFNGARGIWVDAGKIERSIFNNSVPKDIVDKVLGLAQERNQVVQYYLEDGIYANPTNDNHHKLVRRYHELTGSVQKIVTDNFEKVATTSLPAKMLILCEKEDMHDTLSSFTECMSAQAKVFEGTPPFFIEILRQGVDKGNGVKCLCEKLGIDAQKCVGYGDGINDIEFLQYVGHGVVMKNARQIVKDAGNEVSEYSNDDDGVARHLETLFQLQ